MPPLTYLKKLEAESIHVMRVVAAESKNPVMLYPVDKDSSVMLHLALKAFYPSRPPFPLLHVDTTWNFKELIEFRDVTAKRLDWELLVHVNEEGVRRGINPFDSGASLHTQVMKSEALRQALDKYGFDAAFGGACGMDRVFSFRTTGHSRDPENQRPELWNVYNTCVHKGESVRVFPLSRWTELDVWQYIAAERLPIVPLYFAKERPMVLRDGARIMVEDDRMRLAPREKPEMRRVRFRTLGCYPLTGATDSSADTIEGIVTEMFGAATREVTL
jgi:sulfate adenylyltransferase subunit 2